MKNTLSLRRLNVGLSALWLTLAAFCALLCPQSATAGTSYKLNTLTSGLSWATSGIWTPAGPPGTVATDVAILPLAGGAWTMTLDSSPTIAGLMVTNSAAMTLNVGTPSTSSLTFNGTTPAITNFSGQTLTINPVVNLNTGNAVLTCSNNGTIYIVNPGPNFFPNLAASGLAVGGGTLRIGNVTNNIASTNFALMTGAGTLQFDLAGGSTNTFFTNAAATMIGGGGAGIRAITAVDSFSDVTGSNPQSLTNNSTGYLDIQLDGTSPSAALSPTSFGGIGSVTGKNGAVYLEQIHGSNNLGTVGIITANANSAVYLFGPDNNHVATTIVSGGNINLGTGQLEISEGLTLNVDTNMSGFKVNTMMISDGHGNSFYRGGNAVMNWNVTNNANFAIAGDLSLSEPLVNNTSYFNMLGGTLTNGGNINLCQQGHNYDINTAVWTVSGGTQGVANGKGIYMAIVSGAVSGAKAYSYLTITNTGVLNVPAGTVFQAGNRSVTADVLDTRSEATISLSGGTLNLGTPIARQGVTTNSIGAAAWVQFYFNGGTLQLTTNLSQVFTGFGTANSTADGVYVMSGGAVINNGGFNVGISNALLQAASSTGGLTNQGSGTLTLSGVNTYTGPTFVSGGKLITTTASTGGGGYSVADGATNQVVVAAAGQTLSMNGLTLGTNSGATLEFNTAALGSPSAAIVAAGNVTLNGTAIVNIYGTAWTTGTHPLLTYTSGVTTNGGSGFILGSLPLGVNATLSDTTGTELDLVVSAATTSLTWNGNVGSVWDINNGGNLNWIGLPNSVAADYIESGLVGLPVTFDDTATGTTNITLGVTVHPPSLTINNSSLNYTITGAGTIAGPLPLTKNGTGVFTIGVANNFTNPVINSGTLGLSSANNILPVTDTVFFGGTPAALDLGGTSQSLTNINFVTANTSATVGTVQNGKLTVTVNGFNPLSSIAPSATSGTLDLSGLSSFTSSNTAQTFTVQNTAATSGTFKLNLAGTNGANYITAATINVGQGGGTSIPTGNLYLGQTNTLNASTITLGNYRGTGNIYFESGLANSNVMFRGTAGGTSRVSTLTIGAQSSGASQSFTMDLGVANVDALVGTAYVPNTLQLGINETGTVNFGNGTFDILTLDLSWASGSGNGGGTVGTAGNFNQNGGLAKIQTLNLGVNPNTGTPYLKPSYTLNSGTLAASNITAWAATAFNNANTVRNLNLNGGTVSNYDAVTDLTISGINTNSGGVVNLVLGTSTTSTLSAGTGRTIIVQTNALIKGAGNLSVTGGGTVVLDGSGNSYTGLTMVANGTLKIVAGDTALGTAPASATANQLTLNGGTLSLNQGWVGSFSGFSGGSGYTNFPTVSLNQVSGASILAQGGVAGIRITTAGNLLTNVTVNIAPPDQAGGVQATATATAGVNFTTGGGLTSITIGTAGSGYTVPPNVSFTLNSGATTPVAIVTNVTLLGLVNANPGYNFTGTAPTVSFSGGGGSGASATASAAATAAITLSTNRGITLGAAGGTIETVGNHAIYGIITGSGTLTKTGSGTLTLTNANTYIGNTVIGAGTLALTGAGSINNSVLISVAGGAALDASGLSSPLTLGSSQTLSNSASVTGTLAGSLNAGTGTNSVSFTAGTPAFTVTNGTLTLPATSTFIVNNTGSALAVGSYKIISTNAAGFVAGTLTNVIVNGSGFAGGTAASLSISNSELYVVVQNTTTTPPVLNFISTGGGSSLQFSWTGSFKLQSQTNSLTTGLSATGWHDYPGGGTSPVSVSVDRTQGSVFFRLSQ